MGAAALLAADRRPSAPDAASPSAGEMFAAVGKKRFSAEIDAPGGGSGSAPSPGTIKVKSMKIQAMKMLSYTGNSPGNFAGKETGAPLS